MIIYNNYGQTDEMLEIIERNAQKAALRNQILADTELKKDFFTAYLQHGFALASLSYNQQTLSNNIQTHFDGKAKSSLTDRFDENITEASNLNQLFDNLLKQF